jgi:hypothetical protein
MLQQRTATDSRQDFARNVAHTLPVCSSRASKMQASLASLSAASALGYACTNDSAEDGTRNLWIAAGVTMGSIIPYTMLGMMPTNKLLLGMARDAELMIQSDDGSGVSRELGEAKAAPLLQKWCRLHDVRTALSLAGFALAAVALAKSK